MRKIIFGGANSLDNYLARSDHSVDWLLWNDEVGAMMAEFWTRIDTVLMGRKTYEAAVRFGQAGGYPGVKNYVFSRTLEEESGGDIVVVWDDAVEFVRGLTQQEGKDICLMGGGELARSLFEARLIHEIGFNVHPVLLGGGIPLFHPMSGQIDLELKDVGRSATAACPSDIVSRMNRQRKMKRPRVRAVLTLALGIGASAAVFTTGSVTAQTNEALRSCVVIYDAATEVTTRTNEVACRTRLSPASTFKIPHALVALETGVVSADHIEPWDGTPYAWAPAWERDHTVVSAMRPSVVWFFQRIAPRVGADRMRAWLRRTVNTF